MCVVFSVCCSLCPPYSLPPSWWVAGADYPLVAAVPTDSAPEPELEDDLESSSDSSFSSSDELHRDLLIPAGAEPFCVEILVLRSQEISSSLVQYILETRSEERLKDVL